VTCSAIRSGLGVGTRSSRVKISRTCDTVTAGVFPPEAPPLQDQEPQRQKRQRHVVVPAHPTPNLVVRQPGFTLAGLKGLLDEPTILPSKVEMGIGPPPGEPIPCQ
jgi:hypothetical protein